MLTQSRPLRDFYTSLRQKFQWNLWMNNRLSWKCHKNRPFFEALKNLDVNDDKISELNPLTTFVWYIRHISSNNGLVGIVLLADNKERNECAKGSQVITLLKATGSKHNFRQTVKKCTTFDSSNFILFSKCIHLYFSVFFYDSSSVNVI